MMIFGIPLGIVPGLDAVPLGLGSLWTFIPAGLFAIILIIRTTLEDKTLQRELIGYKEYTKKTKYRLFPGIW